MKLHNKNSLLEAGKLKTETVDINSKGVIVTELTAMDYMDVLNSPLCNDAAGEWDGTIFMSLLTAHCIVDDKGNRIYADADAASLRSMSTPIYNKIVAAVKRLNGLTGDETKNSEPSLTESGSSEPA